MNSLTDEALLEAFRGGQSEAYEILFYRYRDMALRVAFRKTLNRQLAEDAVYEVFAAILSAISGGSGPVGAFSSYLYSSVVRESVKQHRRYSRETLIADPEELHSSGTEPFEAGTCLHDTLIGEAFDRLPQRWQVILAYTEMDSMSPSEIAPLFGISPNAVVALHRRAKSGLRRAYQESLEASPLRMPKKI